MGRVSGTSALPPLGCQSWRLTENTEANPSSRILPSQAEAVLVMFLLSEAGLELSSDLRPSKEEASVSLQLLILGHEMV